MPFWGGMFWEAVGAERKKIHRRERRGRGGKINAERKKIHRRDAKVAEKRLKRILTTDPHGSTRTLGLRPFEERFALGLRLEAKKKAQSRRSAVFLES